MVKTTKVRTLGPKAKGPFAFIRYTTRDKSTVELADPTNVKSVNGQLEVKKFTESTSNVANVLIDHEQFEVHGIT